MLRKFLCLLTLCVLTSIPLSAQRSVVPDCKIWKPASFCDLIKGARYFPITHADFFMHKNEDCIKLDKDNCVGVWLKLNRRYGRKFELKSGFENITLLRADGSKANPIAIWWNNFGRPNNGKSAYLSSEMTTNSLVMKYGLHRTADLIMIFPQASPGDKIIVEGYVEATILNL